MRAAKDVKSGRGSVSAVRRVGDALRVLAAEPDPRGRGKVAGAKGGGDGRRQKTGRRRRFWGWGETIAAGRNDRRVRGGFWCVALVCLFVRLFVVFHFVVVFLFLFSCFVSICSRFWLFYVTWTSAARGHAGFFWSLLIVVEVDILW